MQASAGTPTAGHNGTIFFSIELSQKVWLVTLHSPDRDKVSRHHVAGGGYAELLDLIERIRARVERKLVYRPEVASCYEAGYDGFWLHRWLVARGIDSRPYFCTMSSMPMYRQAPLPVSARKAQIGLNLPSYYELTKTEVQRIGADVNGLLETMGPA